MQAAQALAARLERTAHKRQANGSRRLGATGRTGKLVLKRALDKGYQVNCLARKTKRIERNDGLSIFEGNPTNKADLMKRYGFW